MAPLLISRCRRRAHRSITAISVHATEATRPYLRDDAAGRRNSTGDIARPASTSDDRRSTHPAAIMQHTSNHHQANADRTQHPHHQLLHRRHFDQQTQLAARSTNASSSPAVAMPTAQPSIASMPPASSFGTYTTLRVSWAAVNVLQIQLASGKLNAMNQAFWREIREAVTKAGVSPHVRCVWITAQGKIFTAGLDLMDHADSFLAPNAEGADTSRRALQLKPQIEAYQDAFSVFERISAPVVVSIQGACVGGGVDLVTAADIRLASADAWFSVKEVDVGMAADVGTLQRLPKIVSNQSLVREWCFTGRKIPATEALSSGLVSRVLPNQETLLKESLALCVEIAGKSPVAVTGTKAMLNYARDHSVRDSLDYVALWNSAALQSKDVAAAVEFSMAKQQAIFSNL